MYMSEPDLDAELSSDQQEAVYGEIFSWFDEHAGTFTDSGAELQPVTSARPSSTATRDPSCTTARSPRRRRSSAGAA